MIPGIDYIKTVINGILSRITNISKKVDKNSDDIAVLKLDAASTKEEIKASTADWNQNDESAVDYIKNKPFHEETMEETILGEYTGELSGLNPSSNLVYGDKYVIYLDGVRYDAVCGGDSDANNILYVDTEHGWIQINDYCWAINTNITGIHTLKVVHIFNNIYKLDAKFLPDNALDGLGAMARVNPTGIGSFSMGRKVGSSVGANSHAEGYTTTASGECSHAEGKETTASSPSSHAEGYTTTASGEGSHAEGYTTTASSPSSHAEGYTTTASGYASHAEGKETTASSPSSHAEGYRTKASSENQHVQGMFNIEDTSKKYCHITGNGKSSKLLSNAHTLDWNGVPWFQGRPQFGGSSQDNGSQTVMANGDSEIILKSFGGKKFSITVDDTGVLTATEVTE